MTPAVRIYCPPRDIKSNKITLSGQGQLHHLITVMRRKKGDTIFVFDGVAKEYECKIDKLARVRADLTVIDVRKYTLSHAPGISLACAIPKKAKMDYIIEKATELGVERIIPLKTERTYFEVSAQRLEKKIIRWQSIIKEASKQSARIKLPCLSPVSLFNNAIKEAKGYDLAIIPHLGAGNKCIKDAISNFKGKSVIVFIGPEGDFSADEIKKAKENGCIPVSLGEFILKVDTAAIAAVSFLRLSFI
jgi:16S rRNA (uracil1498-N3)-methyltransferase